MNEIAISTMDSRRAERTNLFLIATLYHGGDIVPVRLRNLSHQGALIEAAKLPSVGTLVTLRRGGLEVKGRVVRVGDNKIGVEFFSPTFVQSWLPVKGSPVQRSVDQLAAAIGLSDPNTELAALPKKSPIMSGLEISAELHALKSELTTFGDDLAQDCIFVATHPEVQFLDDAVKRIAKLIDVFNATKS